MANMSASSHFHLCPRESRPQTCEPDRRWHAMELAVPTMGRAPEAPELHNLPVVANRTLRLLSDSQCLNLPAKRRWGAKDGNRRG